MERRGSAGEAPGRRQALAHPAISEVFEITEHIVDLDAAVRDYLDGAEEPEAPVAS